MAQPRVEDAHKAPMLRGFFERCGISPDAQQNIGLAGASLAAVAFLSVGLTSLSDATADRGDRTAQALAPGGIYHMAQPMMEGSHIKEGIAAYANGGEDISAFFDRPSRKQVKDLPTREDRTAALATVAQEQLPDFSKASLTNFASSYHLGATDVAALAATQAPGARGVLDTPGLGANEIASAVTIGGDLERLRSQVADAARSAGQPGLAARILVSESKDVANFAANYGEQEAKRMSASGEQGAVAMAQLSLAGVESLYHQRSPVVNMGRDHPSDWEKTTSAREPTRPVERPTVSRGVDR